VAAMNWNMKKFNAFRRSAGLALVLVMGVYLFSGSGLFCTNETLRSIRALGIDPVAVGITASDDPGEVAGSAWDTAGSQGGSSNCCCKKHKKCPAIPRTAIISNPTHRFYEVQFQAKSACCGSLSAQVTDHRFVTGGDPPLMELAWCAPFFCSNPLALTSVLLI